MYISETNDYQLCGHVLVGQHEGEAQGTSRAVGKGRVQRLPEGGEGGGEGAENRADCQRGACAV